MKIQTHGPSNTLQKTISRSIRKLAVMTGTADTEKPYASSQVNLVRNRYYS